MGLDSHFGDPDVKEEGKWFPVSGEDTELKIRHAGNQDYFRYLRENLSRDAREFLVSLTDDNPVIQSNGQADIDEDQAEEANCVFREAAARHLLVDWKHLSLESEELAAEFDKKPNQNIAYSTENAETLFELLPDFYEAVKDVAQDQSKFRKENQEQDIKN